MAGCVEWGRAKDKDGYGLVKRNGKQYRAHRLVYQDAYGPIPPGMVVMHTCDNPSCINLNHLKLGTSQDNMDDMHMKGRFMAGISHLTGERNGSAKLSLEQVEEIRKSSLSSKKIAPMYGVSHGHVRKIRRGEFWK